MIKLNNIVKCDPQCGLIVGIRPIEQFMEALESREFAAGLFGVRANISIWPTGSRK